MGKDSCRQRHFSPLSVEKRSSLCRLSGVSDPAKSVVHNFVPTQPMSWIIQNQANLKAPWAAKNSSAQIDISYVAVYSYAGKQG